ncbi:hypothetical protein K470DRAFT_156740 [Piedraia hortae CBS 480.64]|uniref:Nitrogen permease regulator 3 n=1 Tax=Piedraia hortae CBS 480.64 TaxID=1314780 RepID=A0A6A7BRF1_9PEZI|nr:hypothetical protein K470DRAFT_156740 [Piedraia hortae CBS 480.64]
MVGNESDALLAILLLIRGKSGPRLVYHYPAEPQLAKIVNPHGSNGAAKKPENEAQLSSSADDDSLKHKFDKFNASYEYLLGYSVDTLETILSPVASKTDKKFELNINGITFVGHPVHVHEDAARTSSIPTLAVSSSPPSGEASILATSAATSTSTGSVTLLDELSMFHVVFVLSTKHRSLASKVYTDLAKRLSRALNYCQETSGYMSSESRKLLALRSSGKATNTPITTLTAQLTETSELAWAFKEILTKTNLNEVSSGLRFSGMEMSLTLTPPTISPPDPHCALLLLTEKPTLLSLLTSTPDLAAFIKAHTPTKSLAKLSVKLSISLPTIQQYATHLVTWRKAVLIPSPLHPRSIYTLSPTATWEGCFAKEYANRFPALPSLPHVLKMLSGGVEFGKVIPSRDHRDVYLDLLGFLVGKGLVVQVRVFGWVKIPHGEVVRDPLGLGKEVLANLARETVLDEEVRKKLGRLVRYFDGGHPLDEMAAREGLKKRAVEEWVRNAEGKGWVVLFRAL